MTEITIPHQLILQSQLRRLRKAQKKLSPNDPLFDKKIIELLEAEIELLEEENQRMVKQYCSYEKGEEC